MNPDSTTVLKICLLGEFGVGKSSLANRLVLDEFSEVYRSTIGVRTLACTAVWRNGTRQRCVVWDVVGEPTLSDLTRRYLVGAQVVLFLADGLRKRTLKAALAMAEEAGALHPADMRRVLVLTKLDQRAEWQISQEDIDEAAGHGISIALTSSRDSVGFDALAEVLGFTIEAAGVDQ
jgi:small GTP-binding protein